ncbi:hypothetical protein DSCW_54220 [Desulfosarcina widdelii]|uniref:Uncharacterized protein n=2 Tax=Desulfosarcina widdelii TaxID=947919 RepID=A0A5K7ZB81_9BACT|nr:hypothetical protein DSCW_54220 [Desulfosarcina widdelii]
MKVTLLTAIVLAAIPIATAWANLTGSWSCNDGGTYYLRQIGRELHWYGEADYSGQPAWANVFSGSILDGRITGKWAAVPKGRSSGAGQLVLEVKNQGTVLRSVENTGGFKGSRWVRKKTVKAAARTLPQAQPERGKDCIAFNSSTIGLEQINGRWKIVDGGHWLFDFGSDRVAAQKALQVINHYRMNRSCFVGRLDPSFAYLLAKGGVPEGPMAGEDCVAFDPVKIRVSKINNRWKIVEGRHWLFDFGSNLTEARQALAIIKRYGFTRSCFVGRPKADFSYLRR